MKLLHLALAVPAVSLLLVAVFLVFPVSGFSDVEFAKAEPREPVTLLFVGDIMLDRFVRTTLATRGPAFVFGGVAQLLGSADLTMGNLEGPITDGVSHSVGTAIGDTNNMNFTFAPTTPSMLAGYGFDLVSIGNNHTDDAGIAGIESTKRYLTESGVAYVGDPLRTSPEPVVKEVQGYRVAFIGYNQFSGSDPQPALQAIRAARRQQVDAIIVMAHWGEEYQTEPPQEVRTLAREMSEAGADLVIGTHSHVVGYSEDIGKTRIYYSLGNFVFDQYWEPGVRCGLAVTATLGDDGKLSYAETHIGMHPDGHSDLICS